MCFLNYNNILVLPISPPLHPTPFTHSHVHAHTFTHTHVCKHTYAQMHAHTQAALTSSEPETRTPFKDKMSTLL